MTPFQELRLWARRAPVTQRATAAAGLTAVVAAVAWTLVPASTQTGRVAATSGGTNAAGQTLPAEAGTTPASIEGATGAGTAAGGTATAGSASGAGAGARSGVGSGTSGLPGTRGCISPPGSAPGVTATQIKVAVTLTQIVGPAANATFNIPPPDEQQTDYQQVIDSINASGGFACRKLVPTFYTANPADQNDLQQKCLDIAASGVFAELDEGGYANYPQKDCYAQHRIPFFGGYIFPAKEMNTFYPYLFNTMTFDTLYHNTILGLRDRGFFSPANGFAKLGFIYRSCDQEIIAEMREWIRRSGVADSQVLTYDVGCPAVFAQASDLEQAVLTFQRNNVTHVTTAELTGDFSTFTMIAQQQNFKPKYGIPDDYYISISYGSMKPDPNNIDGTIAITASRFGEERPPATSRTSGTLKCDAIYAAHNRPPVYQQNVGTGGLICNQLWMFKGAVEHAPTLSREALPVGLQAARSVDFSFPEGPNDFSARGNTVGGQFWRADVFRASCACWQLIDPNFHPSYQ